MIDEDVPEKSGHIASGLRLALRVEGPWWVAYLARRDTMEDAEELGRVLQSIIVTPELRNRFIGMMSDAYVALMWDRFRIKIVMGKTRPAPENERMRRER